jgi:recombination protein RecA
MAKAKLEKAEKKGDMSAERMKAAMRAVEQIQERFGAGSIMKLGETHTMDVEAVPTGSVSLDIALGVGGIPRGRVVEIYGPESSGKTTLAQHIVAEVQKMGGTAAFVDAEHALDPTYAKNIGINIDELLISQPDTGEQALEIVETLVSSNAVDVIVVDSVAALTPQAEIEGDMGQSHMGLQARLMSQALRKLTASIKKSNCIVIFINQIRMKLGVMFGNPETTPGGNALKFYASVRIEIRRRASIKRGEEAIGNRVRVKIAKNKVAAPFQTCEFDIMFSEGISREGDLIDTGVLYGVLKKSGAWVLYGENKIGQGREAAKAYLKQNPKDAKAIYKQIWEAHKKASETGEVPKRER